MALLSSRATFVNAMVSLLFTELPDVLPFQRSIQLGHSGLQSEPILLQTLAGACDCPHESRGDMRLHRNLHSLHRSYSSMRTETDLALKLQHMLQVTEEELSELLDLLHVAQGTLDLFLTPYQPLQARARSQPQPLLWLPPNAYSLLCSAKDGLANLRRDLTQDEPVYARTGVVTLKVFESAFLPGSIVHLVRIHQRPILVFTDGLLALQLMSPYRETENS